MRKKRNKKILLAAVLCTLALCTLTGCKPSKEEVEQSTYYKELQKENKKLKKKVKKLKKKIKENDPTVDETRAADYLDKIARDRLVKLEIGYTDHMSGSEFVEDEAAFSLATAIAKRADVTTRYTVEEIEEKFGSGYEYILYDENNAIYEIYIYEGDYVVFADLPNNVYYARNASVLGKAFLHYQNGYPNSNLIHRLADTPLITDKQSLYYENKTAVAAANCIDQMDKEVSGRKEARKFWKAEESEKKGSGKPKPVEYTFHHHGNQMVLTIYDQYFRLENMDGKKIWYHTSEENVDELKKIFTDAAAENEEEMKDNKRKKADADDSSHAVEIMEESEMN